MVESEYCHIIADLAKPEVSHLHQSHDAFIEMDRTEDLRQAREAAALNWEVVTESDSDNPDDFLDNENAKATLERKIKAIRRKNRRDQVKLISKRMFLQIKVGKKVT